MVGIPQLNVLTKKLNQSFWNIQYICYEKRPIVQAQSWHLIYWCNNALWWILQNIKPTPKIIIGKCINKEVGEPQCTLKKCKYQYECRIKLLSKSYSVIVFVKVLGGIKRLALLFQDWVFLWILTIDSSTDLVFLVALPVKQSKKFFILFFWRHKNCLGSFLEKTNICTYLTWSCYWNDPKKCPLH